MNPSIFISRRRTVPLMLTSLLIVALLVPGLPSRADAGDFETGIGILGGALAGSLIGRSKNREQNALIGAIAGGILSQSIAHSAPRVRTSEYTTSTVQVIPREMMAECREMEIEGTIDGKSEILVGTACRSGNGNWVFQDPPRPSRITTIPVPQPRRTITRTTTIIERTAPRVIHTYPETVIYTYSSRPRHWNRHRHWRRVHRHSHW